MCGEKSEEENTAELSLVIMRANSGILVRISVILSKTRKASGKDGCEEQRYFECNLTSNLSFLEILEDYK